MKNLDVALKNLDIYPCIPQRKDTSSFWMGDHCYKSSTLIYVLEGAFVLNLGDQTYIVQKNQMALLPANQPHTYWKLPHMPLSILQFHNKVECHGEDLFSFFGLTDDHHVVNLPPTPILQCFQQMRGFGCDADNITRRLNLCLQTGQLCLLYVQARLSEDKAKQDFADIIAYMRQHLTKDISLDELAAIFHFEPTYFSKKFKKQMGVSPMKYFAQMRTKYAANLLKTTDMTVSEIAAATGFSDIYYFRTFFARHIGVRPEQYKDMLIRPKELRFSEI